MKKRMNVLAKVLSAIIVASLMTVGIPRGVEAAWTAETKHDIPGYQYKDIYAKETVQIRDLSVDEVTNSTVSPVQTKPVEKPVKFKVFNSTLQKVEKEVVSENGKLSNLELIKGHNYIFFLEDSEYRMNNVYMWVKGKNDLVNIKDVEITPDQKVIYNYGQINELRLYKRDTPEANPEDSRRVLASPVVKLNNTNGGTLAGVTLNFVSDVETLTATTDNKGKILVELLEDVNYMVIVDDNANWEIQSFPIVVKDKSEYGVGKYTYDYSSCAQVDEIYLVSKGNAHSKDTVLTNKNYDEIYDGLYEGIAGNTTIKGMNFKDFLVLERKLDKSVVSGLEGKDYDVLELSLINPHRWEIARLVTGNYEITEEIANGKRVANVYYVDGGLRKIDFKQSGNNVTFSMNTLSMYPIVFEYGESLPTIDHVDISLTEVTKDSAKAKVTVTGTKLPENLACNTFYKKAGSTEPEQPEVDNKILKIKVVDEAGNPVAGVPMYLRSTENEGLGDLDLGATGTDGILSYTFTDADMLLGEDEDTYVLCPTKASGYTCEKPSEISFEIDDEWVPNIIAVDGGDYTGEITLVAKKAGSTEPEQPKEADPKVLNVKVVDEAGNPVSGVPMYLRSTENEGLGDLDLGATGTDGILSYTFTDADMLLGEDEDTYVLCPTKASGYTCEKPSEISFEIDDEWVPNIIAVDGGDYTGEIKVTVKGATKAKMVKATAKVSGEEQTLTDWIATGEAKEVTAKGDENERTFEVTFPVKDFPEALKWTVGVAFELADVEDKQDVKGNEVDIAAYETERQEALDQLKQEIKDAEEYINTLKEKEYTKESWKAYKDAIKEAKDMVEKSASKDEYLAMIQKLADAKTGLEKVNQPGEIPGGGTGTGGNGSGSGNGSGNGAGTGGTGSGSANAGGTGSAVHGNSQKAAQTGDAAPLMPIAVSVVGALAVILAVAAVKRRAK